MPTIRVLLADDHSIFRQGLRALLDKQDDITVVAEASSGREAIELVDAHDVDIVIMDIGMADMNGIEATGELTSRHRRLRVLALSMHSDKRYVLSMLKAGAAGYLLKSSAFEELGTAIRTLMAGETYLSPAISHVVLEQLVSGKPTDDPGSAAGTLTARERQVLQLLAEGKATKEIAAHLHVSVSTVESHRRAIMEKLDLHSVAELTKFAIREGLTSLEP